MLGLAGKAIAVRNRYCQSTKTGNLEEPGNQVREGNIQITQCMTPELFSLVSDRHTSSPILKACILGSSHVNLLAESDGSCVD